MEEAYPGGISSASGDSYYVRLAGGELVAVALVDGAVRWRRASAPRPLAATDLHLLAVDDSSATPVFVLLRAADGREVSRIEADGAGAGDFLEAQIEEAPDGPRILWRSEPRYRGGAHPGILASAGREETVGAFAVDAASGAATRLDTAEWQPPADGLLAGLAQPGGHAHERPELRLRREEDGGVLLEARDPDGRLLWSAPLGRAPAAPPAALRP